MDNLVSLENMSQHSIALKTDKDLTKHEFGLFIRRHYDDVVSVSF